MAESRLTFWSNLAGLAAAIATLIGFGTGTITVSGERFWLSPLFVTLFSLIGIVLLSGSINYLVLDWLKKRLATREFRLARSDEPPMALILLSCCFWVPLFLLWVFATIALNSLNFSGPPDGAIALLGVFSFFALPGGGVVIAFAVFELDQLFSPWMYSD
jgi:hypothetical protein